MMRFIFFVSTIFIFSFAALAQIVTEDTTEWNTLAPEFEEFSVCAPENIDFYSSDDKNINNKYSAVADGTYVFIFSNDLKSGFDDTPIKFIQAYQKAELEKQLNQSEMKFNFSDAEDFFHTIYAVKTKTRAYLFHLVSEKKDDPNVKIFYESLKIKQKAAADEKEKSSTSEVRETVQNPEQQETLSESVGDQGNGRGKGIGSDQGSNSGSADSNSQNTENKISADKDLTLTFKPKPAYNDFARFYGITGNVRVKTTFLDNGSIGAAVPLTKLPFGLTTAAVETAQKMRFYPKVVNGKPVSVTKVVVFNFTIY